MIGHLPKTYTFQKTLSINLPKDEASGYLSLNDTRLRRAQLNIWSQYNWQRNISMLTRIMTDYILSGCSRFLGIPYNFYTCINNIHPFDSKEI